jgi:hypothetical protein
MGISFQPTASAAAPNIEGGVFDARFDGAELVDHPDWAGPGKFGKADDGRRFHFNFTLMQGDEPLYDEGEPVTLEKVTGTNLNPNSKTVPAAVKVLKGLLTTAEFAGFQAGQAPDSDGLVGRRCQLIVSIKENGWPNVDDVMGAKKGAIKARATA